ncbi:conserved hypothetical protein [Uncinocarpus reesii 1704]|uniref:Major facilitator superfamily (MFS) profile domain-containing protein n=1 Tax=Uncinocarpus reesii (strain UAMH 1704) TaxID=336963 RepID=C4JGC9_UNCRE|nr:uncharacterized protein UREG_01120 [Uncinocarpus reesii 1704]EEP76271.1 conserved hypothetical protein [Uncinocarpus reesii 1704]
MSAAPASETTPLLRDNAIVEGGVVATGLPTEQPNDTDVPLADEPTLKELLVIQASIWVGVFFAALDATVVATISAPISSSFNSLSLLSWLASAYLISNAACQPLSGKLTDIFSRRTGLVVSNILFGVGNLICGLAKDEWVMIFGRVVAGMGGGGLTAIATFVTSDLVPLRTRGMWQGIGNICYGVGSGLGGVFGGWINDTWGWRWAFLIQVPFIVVSTVLVWWKVKIPVKETDVSRWKRIDFLGAGALVLTLVLFLFGINTGGNQKPWTHPMVLASLILSGVSLLAFVYIEEKVASEPVIPVRLLADRTVLSACLTNWFCTMTLFAVFLYIPLYLQIQGYSTTQAGTRLIAQAVGTSIGSLGLGFLMRLTGRYLFLHYACVLFFTVGSVLFTTLTINTPAWPPFLYLFITGLGYGGMLTATLVALISAVAHAHQAVVTSASYAFRSTGSSLGITIASSVFQNILKSGLWSRFGDRDDAGWLIPKLRNSLDEIRHLPKEMVPGVLAAYMDALKGVFVTTLGLAVLGAISSTYPYPSALLASGRSPSAAAARYCSMPIRALLCWASKLSFGGDFSALRLLAAVSSTSSLPLCLVNSTPRLHLEIWPSTLIDGHADIHSLSLNSVQNVAPPAPNRILNWTDASQLSFRDIDIRTASSARSVQTHPRQNAQTRISTRLARQGDQIQQKKQAYGSQRISNARASLRQPPALQ